MVKVRKSWKKSSLIFGAISIALLMIFSATAVSQTHGAIAIKKLSQAQWINSTKKKILESKIVNQKPFTKLFSKIKQFLNNETFKKQISKIRMLLREKYGENLLEKINIKSLKEKIRISLSISKLKDAYEKLSSLINVLQNNPKPTLFVDAILGVLLIVISIIPWIGAIACNVICWGSVGLMEMLAVTPPNIVSYVLACILSFVAIIALLATFGWFYVALLLDAAGVFYILPP